MFIISAKRELLQVGRYSKANLQAQDGSYLLLDEFIFQFKPRKPIQLKLSEIPKRASFQVENHSIGHLMPNFWQCPAQLGNAKK